MTKARGKNVSGEMSLFDYVEQAAQRHRDGETAPAGSLDIDAELVAALKDDLRYAQNESGVYLSVAQVAARMSDLTGREITESMFRNWTAPSHPHNFPCLFLPAFVLATGGQRRIFECLSRHSGLFALPGPEALRAEIQRMDEDIKKKKAEKVKREMFLKEMEHGR